MTTLLWLVKRDFVLPSYQVKMKKPQAPLLWYAARLALTFEAPHESIALCNCSPFASPTSCYHQCQHAVWANRLRWLCQYLSGFRAIFCYQCVDFALCGAVCSFFHYHNQLLACFFTVVEKGITRQFQER